MEQMTVGVFVFNDVDLMDITGPIEVFNAVRTSSPKDAAVDNINELYQNQSLFRTVNVSFKPTDYITSSDGTKIIPDLSFDEVDLTDFKIWVIPGGKGIHLIRSNDENIQMITEAIHHAHLSISVCTGAYAVAQTGYLDNEIVTTHWRHLDFFQEEFPHIKLANNARYMHGHKVITAGGVTAGIDATLYLVSQIVSEDQARKAADFINYPWLG